jgi:hypothetical protein
MKPFPHQVEKAEQCWEILKSKGYVYLAGKPRSGKTYTSILTAEKSTKVSNVLVLTKKNAIPGWTKFIVGNTLLKHNYKVINYEQVGSIKDNKLKLKIKPSDYQLVIVDESHNLGTLGKPSNRIKVIKYVCNNMPHIHLSGTAIVESANSIYHQMYISKYTPFKHKNFYDFFREYGKPYSIKANGRDVQRYDKFHSKLLDVIDEFTVYMKQEDAGISKDVQAIDKLHYIELDKSTKDMYNTIQRDQYIEIGEHKLVCDTVMKLRTSLHMLESGILKIDDNYIEVGNLEKINYIKEVFGDSKDVGIMCHFIGERNLLSSNFKFANIYSSNAHAEGVDLSHLKHFIILSSDYSGSKFIQRRDRIVNVNGSNTNIVNHILVKKAISEQVYIKVSKKEDFNNSTYKRVSL